MSPDAFCRLALFVACSGYIFALYLVALYFGVWAALVIPVCAVFIGALITLEETASVAPAPPAEPKGLSHREIDRRSRGRV